VAGGIFERADSCGEGGSGASTDDAASISGPGQSDDGSVPQAAKNGDLPGSEIPKTNGDGKMRTLRARRQERGEIVRKRPLLRRSTPVREMR